MSHSRTPTNLSLNSMSSEQLSPDMQRALSSSMKHESQSFSQAKSENSLKRSLYLNPQQNIAVPTITFVGEDQFKKQNECFVCKSPFGTIKDRQHHCRCCGNSACSICSTRTINQQRVCDICFLKATQLSHEKKRRRFLKAMREHVDKMKALTRAGQQRIRELSQEHEAERVRLQDETELLEQEFKALVVTQQFQEDEKCKLMGELRQLSQLLESKVLMREKLQREESELDQGLRAHDTDIYLKQAKIEEKKQHLEKLRRCLSQLEQSDSFLNLSLYQEASKHETNNLAGKIIAMSISKSLAGKASNNNFASFNPNQTLLQESGSRSMSRAAQLYETHAEESTKSTSEKEQDTPRAHKVSKKEDDDTGGCKGQCVVY